MMKVPRVRDQKKAFQFIDVLDDTLDKDTGKPIQNSIKCIYATAMLGFKSTRIFQVHQMNFFNDFLEVIHKYDGILDVSLENVKKLEDEVELLERQNKQIEDLLSLLPEEFPKEDFKVIT